MFPIMRIPIFSQLPQLVPRSFSTSQIISFSNIHEIVWEDMHFGTDANRYCHLHQDEKVYHKQTRTSNSIFLLKTVAWDPTIDLTATSVVYVNACLRGMGFWYP